MPSRLKRYDTFGHDHFVTFSCYRRLPYLNNDYARVVFLDYLECLRERHRFQIYGYVLMPEHVHLLVSEPPKMKLSGIFRALKTETSKQLKGKRPHFWQPRYYDFNVFTRPKFVEKLRYIHRNPVERGLVENPEDWIWSSYQHWLTGEPGRVLIESDWTWNARIDPTKPSSIRTGAEAQNPTHRTKRDEWGTRHPAPGTRHPAPGTRQEQKL